MPELETQAKTGWWSRLQQAVKRTHDQLSERLDDVLRGRKEIDPQVLGELEAALLAADLGVETTNELLARLRERVERKDLADAAALRAALREELAALLRAADGTPRPPEAARAARPYVVFLVGVNGTGKTTTIAKLARRWQAEGRRVVLCAADTFRAAAGEQLEIWAERLKAELVRQKPGADPAAVVYDAISAARARGADAVFVDTAGRLHTKKNLMAELEKMKRAAGKLVEGAPQEILLVLDATTGQNGLAQARQFTESVGITGIVLTKLDGTAKGGIVVAIARTLRLPIRYLGVGEKLDDLLDFDPEAYAASLFE
ncbi:MAG: signal recognition particle-docking protein FtsY [Acidobacteria bacterium]|nr:signal recognition particle-docking protein FtsY [Acidobacteriota bacterium]